MGLILLLIVLLGQTQNASDIESVLSIAIPSLLFVGLGEELAYRGYVQRESTHPVLIAAVFSLYRLPVDMLTYGFSTYVLALLVSRMAAGMVFGWAYKLTAKSL